MKYRNQLPQLSGTPMITDGGLETVFIFEKEIELPAFASFTLFDRDDGKELLRDYLFDFSEIARRSKTGLIIDTHTWRANPDWGRSLGLDRLALTQVIETSVSESEAFRQETESESSPVAISGCVGPRCDGYAVRNRMTVEEAALYHGFLLDHFAESPVDFATAMTLNYLEEAVGITLAARERDLPVVISFTVETDGKLPSGQALGEAIRQCDSLTDSYVSYFMINCAHPSHFDATLREGIASDQPDWVDRVRGIRANASRMSHAELDEAEELDDGNPAELGSEMADLARALPNLSVFGGCCGTDKRHLAEIARQVGGGAR